MLLTNILTNAILRVQKQRKIKTTKRRVYYEIYTVVTLH